MCDVAKLKGKIAEKSFTQTELANKVEMNRSTLGRKLRKGESFTIGEANKIAEVLKMTGEEAMEIFF